MKALKWINQYSLDLIIAAILISLVVNVFYPSKPQPKPEIRTIVETEIITKTAYVKVNQTEPIEMVVTAYTAGPESTGKRPGMKGYGITYTGTRAKVGVCAVDPEYIPLGSSLFVEGYGYCRAEDTGGKVDGYHVDVFLDKVSDAMKFGREKRKVWILKGYEGEPT
ncbi:3D domain-containing protein [Cohnella kolymensis]|uniref:3D domain-containing protein n=1 Tax=Cohnella kolymensis TaxID=1590652 RepID=UPI000695C1D8|nr:3D domain-containing protein [Cohnella kolymensis]